jgi:hypothetical protein
MTTTRLRNPKHCIKCGKLTSTKSFICMNCSNIDWSLVPDDFWHQFIGLFMGEGSISIRVNKRYRDAPYISLSLVQREDDREVMAVIQNYLGGSIGLDCHGTNPQLRWVLQKNMDIYEVCLKLRDTCVLRSKKMFDVEIAIQYCEWYFSCDTFHFKDYSPAYELREKLMASRPYRSLDCQGADQDISA